MTIADELAKLHDLLTRGAISQSEFDQAKAKLLAGEGSAAALPFNRLRLSNSERWIAGVCGGIAVATGVEAWIWRLLMVGGLFLGGATLLLYLILWIFVPRASEPL
jgi:phage shock protein C